MVFLLQWPDQTKTMMDKILQDVILLHCFLTDPFSSFPPSTYSAHSPCSLSCFSNILGIFPPQSLYQWFLPNEKLRYPHSQLLHLLHIRTSHKYYCSNEVYSGHLINLKLHPIPSLGLSMPLILPCLTLTYGMIHSFMFMLCTAYCFTVSLSQRAEILAYCVY